MTTKAVVGRTRFVHERQRAPRAPGITATACISCGQALQVTAGEFLATFRIGRTVIGVACTICAPLPWQPAQPAVPAEPARRRAVHGR
jgi:hypothetical protein